ncbi:hypothetical protein [Sharpea azabuensis]|uniref:hypothetical protein n=1 Tax=Sharpea azabuensis TaxID=322505 RepID=UPI00156AA848|nr:hypothetical protein [Sharpea azabuensis]
MMKNRSELKHRDIYLKQLIAFQKIVLTLHKLINDDIEGIVIKYIMDWLVE